MKRSLVLSAGLLLAGAATAHPGHADVHLPTALAAVTGLTHPLGADHLLAMLAVGLWSAAALPAAQRLRGPVAFLLALLVGAVAGRLAGAPALVEAGIVGSVVLFGVMLMAPGLLPGARGLALVAGAGLLHGLAHGAEGPAGPAFAAYAAGFLASTTLLHAAGLMLGQRLRTLPQRLTVWAQRLIGGALGLGGLALWLA